VSHRILALALVLAAASPLAAQIPQSEYADRRARLAEALPDGAFLSLGAPEPAADYLPFAQATRFRYLTGFTEPDAALLMLKQGGRVTGTLFVLPNDPATETWTGRRAGLAAAQRTTGLPTRPIEALEQVLDSLLTAGTPLAIALNLTESGDTLAHEQLFLQALTRGHTDARIVEASAPVMRLRGTKSAAEQDLLRKAVAITVTAQQEALRLVEPGMNEFEVQALIEYTFRRNGAERPGFASIVGSGPNSTALHYSANDRFMQAGDLLVMDIGALYGGYSADVTRTVPVSGTFTPEQRAIYQIVRDAQAAAERQVRIGGPMRALSDSATAVMAAGLTRLGLIDGPRATYDCGPDQQCLQLRMYYMHGLGHGIGLDVHDPDQYEATGRIAAGSVFTIEPGLYVRENLLEILPDTPGNRALAQRIGGAVRAHANIGVRIEDDYVITARGMERLSTAPREIAEIEAAMRKPYAGPAPRDPARVEWYRQVGGAQP